MRFDEIWVGVPGCGKTHTALQKAGPFGRACLYLTFTCAAAREAAERTGVHAIVRTVHSHAYRECGPEGRLIRWRDFMNAHGHLYAEIDGRPDPDTEGGRMLAALDYMRHCRISPAHAADRFHLQQSVFGRFMAQVERFKRENTVWDYTDLLLSYLREVVRNAPYECLIVDEAQDNTPLMWDVIHRMAHGVDKRFCFGDDDQAIYGFLGATGRLPSTGTTQLMQQSRRLPRRCAEIADHITERIQNRVVKHIRPRDVDGEVHLCSVTDLPNYVRSWGRMTILVRNRYQIKILSRVLAASNIYYQTEVAANGTLTAETRECMRLFMQHHRDDSLRPAELKQVNKRLGTDDWRYKRSIRVFANRPDYRQVAALRGRADPLEPDVFITTIHGFKGREANNIGLFLETSQNSWRASFQDEETERRVWYTAVTRARERLLLIANRDGKQGSPIVWAAANKFI